MFSALTPEQARYSIETTQQFDGWRVASERVRKCAGTMSWKNVGGRTYLVRTHDRRGGQISLGPRSLETEAVFEQFSRDKDDAVKRLRLAEARLAELARMNVALRLGRLPQYPFDPDQLRMFPTALRHGVSTVGNPLWSGA